VPVRLPLTPSTAVVENPALELVFQFVWLDEDEIPEEGTYVASEILPVAYTLLNVEYT
jgi:hypothetical protein